MGKNIRKDLDKVLRKEKKERQGAEVLQEMVINRLKKMRPKSLREFYRLLLNLTWDVRDKIGRKDPSVHRIFLTKLVRRIEISCERLRELDEKDCLVALQEISRRVWKLQLRSAGEDEGRLLSLLTSVNKRRTALYAKLPKPDDEQLDLLGE